VRIDRERTLLPDRLGTSRLGGPPDLPSGVRWPTCGGRRQSFLAQLRVRDLPPAARPLRRVGGRLWVFTDVEFEPGETVFGLWAGRCTRVIHAAAGARLRRTPRPRGTMRLRPARMTFRTGTGVPEAEFETEHRLLGDLVMPNGGGGRCWERTRRRTGAWRHLLTIGSDSAVRFEVADAGRLQVAIAPADLRRGRFDRVCGIFDSA
jgi:hypothetical protein